MKRRSGTGGSRIGAGKYSRGGNRKWGRRMKHGVSANRLLALFAGSQHRMSKHAAEPSAPPSASLQHRRVKRHACHRASCILSAMISSSASPGPQLLSPRYWPSWIGIGVIWLIARLPYRALFLLGRGLGFFTALLPGERRHVARRNIEICLPELTPAEQAEMLRASLADLGLMLAEFAFAWMASDRALARVPCTIEGIEHLDVCRKNTKGVLLVGAHFSQLELCARLVSQHIRIAGMYRVMDDPVFERSVLRARLGYAEAMFTKDDIRASVRYLKRGGALWYAPDQDMRGKDSVFVPFFG